MTEGKDFYLPAKPPETLRPFTLQVLVERRVVGSAVRRVPIKPHSSYPTGRYGQNHEKMHMLHH